MSGVIVETKRYSSDLVRAALSVMDKDMNSIRSLFKNFSNHVSGLEADLQVEEDGPIMIKSRLKATFWDGQRWVDMDWTRSKTGFSIVAGPVIGGDDET